MLFSSKPLAETRMVLRYTTLLILVIVLITSCNGEPLRHDETMVTDPTPLYEYRIGLGYGFLGKEVRVVIDGSEVLSEYGTNEIEQYAQLRGTYMITSGWSANKDITLQVTIDGGKAYEQTIDLSASMFIHIYQEQEGLNIYNTRFHVEE